MVAARSTPGTPGGAPLHRVAPYRGRSEESGSPLVLIERFPGSTTVVQGGTTAVRSGTTAVQGGTTAVQGGTTAVQGGATVAQGDATYRVVLL